LESKHPNAWIPEVASLPKYTITPDFVDVSIYEESDKKVAQQLSGSAGLGGTDGHALQHWLLRFGMASQKLRKALAEVTNWLANDFPPWPAYRALMAGQLSHPGQMPWKLANRRWQSLEASNCQDTSS
jgi:hypothetical protein